MKNASPTFRQRLAIASVAVSVAANGPSSALAGAWTLPKGQGQIIQTLLGWVGWASPVANGGREDKVKTQTYVQYGLTDGLTLLGTVSVERYALSSPKDVYAGLDKTGAGLRARVWSNDAWTYALEASAFYGGASQQSRPAQAGGAGPGAEARALVGHNLSVLGLPAFLDMEAGYRARTQGPPSEWNADLTLGVQATPKAQVLLQTFNTISQGRGQSGFPAFESHKAEVSLVYALDDKWSVQMGVFATVWRRNTTSEYGAVVAVWRKF